MKSTVQFYISRDDEGYTASGVDLGVVTEADSLDALMVNIHEAVVLHFEDEDSSTLGYKSIPAILVNSKVYPVSLLRG